MANYSKLFWKRAADNDLPAIQQLYSQQADVINLEWKSKKYGGATALVRAAWCGWTDIVAWMLDNTAAQKQSEDGQGYTALHYAAMHGETKMVDILLAHNVAVNVESRFGDTALICACRDGYEDVANLLLAVPGVDARNITNTGDSALLWAIRNEMEDIVLELIRKGANVNGRNESGETPLLCACEYENENIVKILLAHGAARSMLVRDQEGRTPVVEISHRNPKYCISYGSRLRILQAFLKTNPNLRLAEFQFDFCATTTLYRDFSTEAVLDLLADHGADMKEENRHGQTILHRAAASTSESATALILRKLLALGADQVINAKDYYGYTPLMMCAKKDHGAKEIQVLLDHNADSFIRNHDGKKVADMAAPSCRAFLASYTPIATNPNDLWSRLPFAEKEIHAELWSKLGGYQTGKLEIDTVLRWLVSSGGVPKRAIATIQLVLAFSSDQGGIQLPVFACILRLVALSQADKLLGRDEVMNVQQRLVPRHPKLSVNLSHSKLFFKYSRNGEFGKLKSLHKQQQREINVNWRNCLCFERTALMEAAFFGHVHVTAWLLEHTPVDVKHTDQNGDSALHRAYENVEITRLLLKHGADVNAQNMHGETALMIACKADCEVVAQVLLDHGAEKTIRNTAGETAFEMMDRSRSPMCCALLQRHNEPRGTAPDREHHTMAFMSYIVNSQFEQMRKFYEDHREYIHVNLDFSTPQQDQFKTPLMLAAEYGKVRVVKFLITEAHADPDVKFEDDTGQAALLWAAYEGRSKVAHLLLWHGADIHITDYGRTTALHKAIAHRNSDTLQLLLDYGPDLDVRNDYGEKPLDVARREGFRMVQILIEHGIFPHSKGCHGQYGLLYRMRNRSRNLVNTLVRNESRLVPQDTFMFG